MAEHGNVDHKESSDDEAVELEGGTADFAGEGENAAEEEGGSQTRWPSGARSSVTSRRDTSSTPNFFGRPAKRRRSGPTELQLVTREHVRGHSGSDAKGNAEDQGRKSAVENAGGSTNGIYPPAGGFYDDQGTLVWWDGQLGASWDDATAALQLLSHCRHIMGRRADWRTTDGNLRKRLGLETLAVKAFGDMGQTARLQLIRDRFIAGHSSCELRRYLDSVPPETPIRDVVDRCRVWGCHTCQQTSEQILYLIRRRLRLVDHRHPYFIHSVVRLTDHICRIDWFWTRLTDLPYLWVRVTLPVPAPVPEVPMVEKLLQRLVAENQRYQPAPVIRDEPVGLEKLLRSYLSGQQTSGQQSRQRPARRGWNDLVCFHAERRVMGRIVAPPWMIRFCLCCRDGGLSRPRVVS